MVHRGLSLSDAAPSLLLSRVVPKDILENGSTFLPRADIQHNALQWAVSPQQLRLRFPGKCWSCIRSFALEAPQQQRLLVLSLRSSTAEASWEFRSVLLFKFTISKPLGEVLGPVLLWESLIAKWFCPGWRLLSRIRFDAVFHVEAAGLSLQVPHLPKAPLPLSLASGASRRFTGEQSVVTVPSAHLSRVRTRCRRTAGLASPSP